MRWGSGFAVGVVLVVLVGVTNSLLVEHIRDRVVRQIDSAWGKIKVSSVFSMYNLQMSPRCVINAIFYAQGLDNTKKPLGQTLKDLAQILSRIPYSISEVERELMVFEYDEALKSLSKVRK